MFTLDARFRSELSHRFNDNGMQKGHKALGKPKHTGETSLYNGGLWKLQGYRKINGFNGYFQNIVKSKNCQECELVEAIGALTSHTIRAFFMSVFGDSFQRVFIRL